MRIFMAGFGILFMLLVGAVVVFGRASLIPDFMRFESSGKQVRVETISEGLLQEVVSAPGEIEPPYDKHKDWELPTPGRAEQISKIHVHLRCKWISKIHVHLKCK